VRRCAWRGYPGRLGLQRPCVFSFLSLLSLAKLASQEASLQETEAGLGRQADKLRSEVGTLTSRRKALTTEIAKAEACAAELDACGN